MVASSAPSGCSCRTWEGRAWLICCRYREVSLQARFADLGRPQFSLPLMLTLVYTERHADELQRRDDARQTVQRWLAAMG